MPAKKLPFFDAGNQLAARLILADPEKYLRWPEPLTPEEIEASFAVRWARKVLAMEGPIDDKK